MKVIHIMCPITGKLINTGMAAQDDGRFGKISNMSVSCPFCPAGSHPIDIDGTQANGKGYKLVEIPVPK